MMDSVCIRVALVFLGLSTVINSSALLYSRDPSQEAPCSDTTSISCSANLCCRELFQTFLLSLGAHHHNILVSTAICENRVCVATVTAPQVCPTDPNLEQCPTESFCCREPFPSPLPLTLILLIHSSWRSLYPKHKQRALMQWPGLSTRKQPSLSNKFESRSMPHTSPLLP